MYATTFFRVVYTHPVQTSFFLSERVDFLYERVDLLSEHVIPCSAISPRTETTARRKWFPFHFETEDSGCITPYIDRTSAQYRGEG